ncbi:MAG: glycosyltransferase family 4 protein [Candidatus Falkowbacteria bacterium]|nr:MAG: glycosyltransferase family 4 protein [Candidatus Falkowbacteria bacterium]
MKIAFIGQKGIPAQNGGVDRHVENLAMFLAKKGEQVIVYNRQGYLPEKINKWEGVTLVHLPYINQKNLAAITHSFLATLDAMRRKVDVMHYHGIGPCLLAWIPRVFASKIKVVATLHSFDYGNEKWGRFAKFMLKRGERSMSRYAHEVIVLTDLMHDYLLQKHGKESSIIPNGAYIENNSEINYLLRFGLEPKKYLVSVSRIIKLKGIQYLIAALKELPTYDIKLAIVGDGEYREELEKLAGNDPRIVFTGNQSGEVLNQLYSQAKYFIQSSEMEGLSISLLEAMAHGLPCIVSDIPANQEATGETALYFRQKDKDDLRNKLIYAFEHEDKMTELGVKAKERAVSLFNWEKISEDTLKIYKK